MRPCNASKRTMRIRMWLVHRFLKSIKSVEGKSMKESSRGIQGRFKVSFVVYQLHWEFGPLLHLSFAGFPDIDKCD